MAAEADLMSVYDKLQRAADLVAEGTSVSCNEERAVDSLRILRDFNVTTQLLVTTQIGKKIRKLSKHKNEKIASAAAETVETWKKIVSVETGSVTSPRLSRSVSSPDAQPSPGSKSVRSEPSFPLSRSSDSLPSPSSLKKESNGQTSSKFHFDTSKIPKTGEIARDKFRELIAAGLSLVHDELAEEHRDMATASHILKKCIDVEVEMWKTYGGGKSDKEYKARYRSISFNIKDPQNPDLRRRVLLGEIPPSELVLMTPEGMASDAMKEKKGIIQKKMLFESTRGQTQTASTDQFRCGKCGKRKTTYYQMQTRSADEPMTTYVSCLNCDNRWKFC